MDFLDFLSFLGELLWLWRIWLWIAIGAALVAFTRQLLPGLPSYVITMPHRLRRDGDRHPLAAPQRRLTSHGLDLAMTQQAWQTADR
jgi:hypothetical protein